MFVEWALGAWSGAGLAWWVISLALVRGEAERTAAPAGDSPAKEFISIFKPLAPLGAEGVHAVAAGLESFIGQLDERSELLLGIHQADRKTVEPFLGRMREANPEAKVVEVYRTGEDEVPNPKIAWQKVLAEYAQGDLWLWSDADIQAPDGFFARLRLEWAEKDARMMTFPYVVREVVGAPAFLDALYVNADFYPGVLLLRRCGPVDFGLGAGMLFRRDEFLAKVTWEEIGAALADDFVLGQKLKPVRVSGTTLATVADVRTWREAVLHYLRWCKTVWWNRPGGSAARVVVLPILGWMGAVAWHPGTWWTWAGLVALMQMDVLFAAAINQGVGCRWRARDLLAMEAWSVGRGLAWLACWFSWPVNWRGKIWTGPRSLSKTN